MKKRFSTQTFIALMAGAGLTLLCMLFALVLALGVNQPDPTLNTSTLRNPLDGAKNGVSMLLRADQSNDEYFGANYFPTLLGAKGDGVNNDTSALKGCLEDAAEHGGTVYLPQGIYRITEPLTIPANVTLRGDFSAPNSKIADGANTVLLVADNEELRESPFITLASGASLMGITVYYEKQSPDEIIEYPASVYCTGNAALHQITLLNSYHGICVTGDGKADLRSLWISPLDYGILVTDNSDTVTVEDCQISPTYWLNYAPAVFSDGKGYAALTGYLHQRMHGIILEKVTDVTLNRISTEGAAVGILFNVPRDRDGILLGKEVSVSFTERPVYLQSLPKSGICFIDSTLRPNNEAGANTVEIGPQADAPVLFSACTFAGLPKTVVKAQNNSFVSFYHCNFGTWWNVCFEMESDTFLAVAPTFKTDNEKASLGQNAFGLLYDAQTIEESSQLLFSIPEGTAKATQSQRVTALKNSQRTFTGAPVINALDYGASPESEDNTSALNEALEAAAKAKGTVFLPEGTYKFKSTITVPESVRLVGVGHSGTYATLLNFELQKNTKLSLIELQPGASVENLEVRQGSILPESVDTYAVSSLYPDVRIWNVSLSASRGIWLTSAKNALIEQVTAKVTETGIFLQNMKDTTLHNVTISDPSGSYGTTGIRLENSSVTLSEFQGIKLACGLELIGATDLSATLFTLRGPSVGIRGNHTGNALLTAVGFSEAGQGGSTLFLEGGEEMSGKITLQGMIGGGTSLLGNLISAQKGTVELRAGVLTTPFITTIQEKDQGKIAVYGCILDSLPAYHATVSGGTVTLEANLLRSEKTFEGPEGNYLLTSVKESGTVEDGINLIQHVYVYVESEDTAQNQDSQ